MNKSLLFFTKINFGNSQNKGYWIKVNAQSNAFRKLGWNVDILYVFKNEVRLENSENCISLSFNSRIKLLFYLFVIFPTKLIKGQYSAIYIRHFLTNPLFLIFLMKSKPKVRRVLMEIPTFPYSFEYKGLNKNRILYFLDKICSYFFKYYIDRIISFSFDKTIFKIPTINTDNGVEVTSINYIEKPPKFNKELRILGLGNPRTWHAYERIIYGMQKYYQQKQAINVVFDIVGDGGEIDKYIKLTKEFHLEDKINFHGYKSGNDLDMICQQCHVAVASLGMHRINVSNGEASPLKAREFAARGIPFLTGYKDKGFPIDFPFIFNFPSNESPIDIEKLIQYFSVLIKNHSQYPNELRQFALNHLDWSSKMIPVVDYLNENASIP